MFLLLLLSGRIWTRLDLSAGRLNTLSKVSRNLYSEIEDTVRITYYCSGRLASVFHAPAEIADLLQEYAARSRGKIQVSVKDPSPDYLDDMERFGLLSQSLPNVGKGELSVTTVYSGLVIEYLNKVEVIPWITETGTLEYDVTSRIRALAGGRKREVGVMTPDPQKTLADYYEIFQQVFAGAGIGLTPIGPGGEIPDTLPALFVFGGVESLGEYELYRIDRYIRLGGRVLFAVEGVDVLINQTLDARPLEDRGLLAMLASYGAVVGRSLVLDKSALVMPYNDMNGQLALARYPFWVGVLGENGNKESALTSGFGGVDLFWASPITLALPENGAVEGEVLFSSTSEAWLMTRDFLLGIDKSPAWTAEAEETTGAKTLGVSLSGLFPSWFKEAKPDAEGRPPLPDMPEEAKKGRVVVIGDSEMASFMVRFAQGQNNFDFLLQAADWLGNDGDIVGIRNRSANTGRLDRISDDAKRLSAMNFAIILNVVIVPLLVLVFGAVRVLNRRPEEKTRRRPQADGEQKGKTE